MCCCIVDLFYVEEVINGTDIYLMNVIKPALWLGATTNIVVAVMGHYVREAHRHQMAKLLPPTTPEAASLVLLSPYPGAASNGTTVATPGRGVSWKLHALFLGVLVCSAVVYFVTSLYPVITFNVRGIAGRMIDLPFSNEGAKRTYSMDTLVTSLPHDAGPGTGISAPLTYLACIYVLLMYVGPIITFLLGLGLAFFDERYPFLDKAYDYASAWSGVDVFVLVAVAGWWQINLIGEWLIEDLWGDECDDLHKHQGVDCVHVDTKMHVGLYLAAACSAGVIVYTAFRTALRGVWV